MAIVEMDLQAAHVGHVRNADGMKKADGEVGNIFEGMVCKEVKTLDANPMEGARQSCELVLGDGGDQNNANAVALPPVEGVGEPLNVGDLPFEGVGDPPADGVERA